MASKKRPGAGRPPGRRGRGGVGPGPGYRSGNTGSGTSHTGKTSCCPMVAAVRSVRQGRYRLARRYAVMSVRLLAGGLA